jgi:catechol 2,3-dioxygenase-like lactoylglutathione lyase family enzyme
LEVAIRNVVIDCNDPDAMTRFWQELLGFEVKWSSDTYRFMLHPDGRRPGLVLQTVPEPATEKNRLHLDLEVADVDAAVRRAEDLGATRIESIQEDGIAWTVLRDPEGNYFCLQQAGV